MGEYSTDNLKLSVGGKLMEGYSNIGIIGLERGKSNGPIAVTKVTFRSGVYDSPDSCNKCGKRQNKYLGNPWDGGEIATTCQSCGHEDSWECGHFHSGCDGLNASEKYGSGCK